MKKKLLIAMPVLSRGGGERVVSELSGVFAEHVDLVIAVFEKKDSYRYQGRAVDLGVPLSDNFFARVFLFFKRLWRLKEVIEREKPDKVMTLGLSVSIMAILVARDPIVRVDMFISAARKGVLGFVARLLANALFRRAGLVVAVSVAIAADMKRRYGVPCAKLRTIYNPVDVLSIQRKAREEIAPQCQEVFSRPVVVTMGRLTEQKGQWHLIRAFRAVREQIPDAQLVILGEGELRGRLEQLARDLGTQKSMHVLGWQENPFAYLRRAQVFVLPSLWEGLPDVLLEALGCGLPLVSADCRSGPREILAPTTNSMIETKRTEQAEYGVLVPVCDGRWREAGKALAPEEHMMADAVIGLLENKEARTRLAEKAAQRARDFDIATIAPQWSFLWE